MTSRLTLADRWTRYWYLQSVEIWLDPMPGQRRRAVLRELKGNLEAAAADVGMGDAIADLGRPRELARQYVEQEPAARPRWSQGILASVLVFGAWLYATLFYTVGMLDALESTSVSQPAEGNFLGTRIVAIFTDAEISAELTSPGWVPFVITGLAFLLASRAWHALPRTRSLAS